MSGMAPTVDEQIASLAALIGSVAGAVSDLTAEVAHLADRLDGSDTAPAPVDVSHIRFTNEPEHLPLIEPNEENSARRVALARMLDILGTPAGNELVLHGARGFYRGLMREPGAERIELRRDIARGLVEDALTEDPDEAAEMGRDLLAIWDEDEDAESFAARNPFSTGIIG